MSDVSKKVKCQESRWNTNYNELRSYFELHGNSDVPRRYQDNPALANWVMTQRACYKKGTLSQLKIDKLNQLNFKWSLRSCSSREIRFPQKVNSHELGWNASYDELRRYFELHGNSNVPKYYQDNQSLSNWVMTQRACYKKGTLSQLRIDKLNQLNFKWSLRLDWDVRFEELVKYKEIYGHTNVPFVYKENPALGHWVRNQRHHFKEGSLKQDRAELLTSIGFQFEIRRGVKKTALSWDDCFLELKKFIEKYNHSFPSGSYLVNGFALGNWVSRQRIRYRKGELSIDQMKKMDSLKVMEVSRNDFNWESRYNELIRFQEIHGHCNVPLEMQGETLQYFNDKRLSFGQWVAKQRTLLKKGQLSQEQVAKLNAINFMWIDKNEESWEKMRQQLISYKEKNGTINFLTWNKNSDLYHLSVWVNNQRNAYRKNKLSLERIRKLEEIDFVWEPEKVKRQLLH